jgi:D-alanine-D-alanine ligase
MSAAPRLRVAVLGGGISTEHEVSLASARDIGAALDPRAYEVVAFTRRRDGGWLDATGRAIAVAELVARLAEVDVVIPAFHGRGDEDGTIAGLLEVTGTPYVGAGPLAGALAMDKRMTKLVARELGIDVAPGIVVTDRDDPRLACVDAPAVVKPVHGGSSIGVTLVTRRAELEAAVELALRDDDGALVEAAIEARELDVGVLELGDGRLQCAPPLEIHRGAGVFDTAMKYGGEPPFTVPALLDAHQVDSLQAAAVRMFRGLGCRGLARVDFFLDGDRVILNEVNTFPGFTRHSQFPRMFAAAGRSYAGVVEHLIRGALLQRDPDPQKDGRSR